ncbi:hypothetical protein [Caulobacter sp. 17J80-11]|uniref:hypothetical protein n=1 Tax=Caulobacter sp. 17J80-11 TaxID=2763502 RepID=UPI001653B337|nr:hypothetical protein [Caulobacter sp. 17J80-11]MBC6982218.1 hypothetical protein [Caulobacter sp. 17J80-11]
MNATYSTAADARFLAQERIVDALIRVLSLRHPELLDELNDVLSDTAHTHAGTPSEDESVQHQVRRRLAEAQQFTSAYGGGRA